MDVSPNSLQKCSLLVFPFQISERAQILREGFYKRIKYHYQGEINLRGWSGNIGGELIKVGALKGLFSNF